jgi:hypothetical protein
MSEDAELEVLLSLDGASWEAAEGYMVEFRVHRTQKTVQRPHGINYALVFRLAGGEPFVRFDNAHAAKRPGGRFVRLTKTHDHWHRGELLEDFWREVKRAMNERGIPNDL